jgi:ribosome-binding factor A
MSGQKRNERVGDLLRDEISSILRTAMRDPRLELVGVTAVEVSRDLAHAKVYVSSARPDVEMEELLRVLRRARGFIRVELSHRHLDLRHLPELDFVHDRSIEQGSRIEELLRSLERPPASPPGASAAPAGAPDAPTTPDARPDSAGKSTA